MTASGKRGNRGAAVLVCLAPFALCLLQTAWFHEFNRRELGLGLPIDDAYIFQRYAENLAAGKGFSFNPGETSFGCTSLIWPVLQAIAFRLFPGLDHVTIAFWLGGIFFAASAALTSRIIQNQTNNFFLSGVVGLLVAASPLLFMNAVSGMEPPLTMLLFSGWMWMALGEKPRPLSSGLLAGLMTLNRPEAAYFAFGAVAAWLLLKLLGKERPPLSALTKFLVGWAVLCLPPALWIHSVTGSVLPTTYLGKIVSSVPSALSRGWGERLFWSALSLAHGWKELLWPLHLLAPLLGAGILYRAIRWFRKGEEETWPRWGELVIFGYFLLPGVYGFSFPVHPPFGGYYVRYIAHLNLALVLAGGTGLFELWLEAGRKRPFFLRGQRFAVVTWAALLSVVIYQGHLWWFQKEEGRKVFAREVKLNTGLRREAALWISRPENVPVSARVMVGYTGLGVVGGFCGRYVLDLGALINPDIFPYYRQAGQSPRAKWENVVKYMRDHGVDYYVTFAFTSAEADRIPDPAATAGFQEVVRLGRSGEPRTPYEQIRIYKITWNKTPPF